MKYSVASYLIFITVLSLFSCSRDKELFSLLPSEKTGIGFINTIPENDTFNIFIHEYIYNGGGVGIGDFNRDGLNDVLFTGNIVDNKLYLNRGNLEFQDVSAEAGIEMPGQWSSGIAVVDINQDGWPDIYITATFREDGRKRRNRLFINQGLNEEGIPLFKDAAEEWGIADEGHSTNAVFFDYDLDGDLDLYVLTNVMIISRTQQLEDRVRDGTSETNDRLYRNNGNGTFTDVSEEAGILTEGFGLGIAIRDFNNDRYPDVYISNDFITNDVFWMNNGDGTFTNRIAELMKHQSFASMGNDAADFNNDGYTDMFTLDMLPTQQYRVKQMYMGTNYRMDEIIMERGYEPQYMRNMMQVNNAARSFSEISQVAGVEDTDWTWSVLFADYDNDGLNDISFTNGFPRDITDHDFTHFRRSLVSSFMDTLEILSHCPTFKSSNYFYKNRGDYRYDEVTDEWGLKRASYSNGAAFADLDNDGDLDFVTNNINDPAFVYENKADKIHDRRHWIKFRLKGEQKNRDGFGARIKIRTSEGVQWHEHNPSRGYISFSDPVIHFGLGTAETIDSLWIFWPTGKSESITGLKADTVYLLDESNAEYRDLALFPRSEKTIFMEEGVPAIQSFIHHDKKFLDFAIQLLMPHRLSQEGPGIAVGDINGDGLEDFFTGNGRGASGIFFLQNSEGEFIKRSLKDTVDSEDTGVLLFDADNDNDLDLYIVSGSSEFKAHSRNFQDRLYLNDGTGNFHYDPDALPEIRISGSVVSAADFDRDGDLDLFVGGRQVPQSYPLPEKSLLLLNEGGKFVDVTEEYCPEMLSLGMVTTALWTDFDQDGWIDLIVTGDWMPVTLFRNNGDGFTNVTARMGMNNTRGWWNSITAVDFDKDGDMDYILGNQGLNNKYGPVEGHPLNVLARDFNNNGVVDNIISSWREGDYYPVHLKNDIDRQIPYFRKKYPEFRNYSLLTTEEIFADEDMEGVYEAEADIFESILIENENGNRFKWRALPVEAQFAPVNGMVSGDFNRDGEYDILMVGNDHSTELFSGKHDAFIGLVLAGDGRGNFEPVSVDKSGFFIDGDAKALVNITGAGGGPLYIASQNSDSLKIFRNTDHTTEMQTIYPEPSEYKALIEYKDGKTEYREFYYGSSYLSHPSRALYLHSDRVARLVFYDYQGKERVILLNSRD